MAAKKKEIRVAAPPAGLAPKMKIVGLYVPEKKKSTQMLTGAPAEVAAELIKKLREDARVL
jgi:electron transfer flavoprotein beta subunit